MLFEVAGRLGMSESEFDLTTPRYFFARQKGAEKLIIEEWKRARFMAYYSVLPHTKKNALRSPNQLLKLPGDEWTLDEEERAYMAAVLKKAKTIDVFKGETMPKA